MQKKRNDLRKEEAFKSFFLGNAVERCASMVVERNRYNLNSFALLGIAMMSFANLFGFITKDVFTFNAEFIMMWAYFMIMYIVNKIILPHIKHVTRVFYFWVTPIMLIGIIMGTFGDPTQPSITIMVFLCVLPLFILDKPWRIVSYILMNAVLYTICCYLSKSNELFVADMIDLILFGVLGIGVNCLILRDRISNVEYAMNMMIIADKDALTKINNRRSGVDKIRHLIEQGKCGMFLLIDLDDFKKINDQYGHTIGDKALISLAECLQGSVSEDDVVMRFGGDEFAVYLRDVAHQEDGERYIKHLIKSVHKIALPEIVDYQLSVSIGVSMLCSSSEKSFEMLYSESDEALYRTKYRGKDSYSFFE